MRFSCPASACSRVIHLEGRVGNGLHQLREPAAVLVAHPLDPERVALVIGAEDAVLVEVRLAAPRRSRRNPDVVVFHRRPAPATLHQATGTGNQLPATVRADAAELRVGAARAERAFERTDPRFGGVGGRSRWQHSQPWRNSSISDLPAQQLQRPAVGLTLEVPAEQPVKRRARGRHAGEQRRAGSQLHVVGGTEDLDGGRSFDSERRLGALHQPRPEHGVARGTPRPPRRS